jgi:hypothetical protein
LLSPISSGQNCRLNPRKARATRINLMAETLGSLCDKLTIVKLKQWHTDEPARRQSLELQERQLRSEIDEFLSAGFSGAIPTERLTFAANKVYKREGNAVAAVTGGLGEVFSRLAGVNCALWHEQEKVYEFETVPAERKNALVKNLALLNLERNECIDQIDRTFRAAVEARAAKT